MTDEGTPRLVTEQELEERGYYGRCLTQEHARALREAGRDIDRRRFERQMDEARRDIAAERARAAQEARDYPDRERFADIRRAEEERGRKLREDVARYQRSQRAKAAAATRGARKRPAAASGSSSAPPPAPKRGRQGEAGELPELDVAEEPQ